MKYDDAIISCQARLKAYTERLKQSKGGTETKEKIKRQIELEKIKIEALQEKAEREKGCEYCNESKDFDVAGDSGANIIKERRVAYIKTVWLYGDALIEIKYCPMCGRKLGEK